MDAGLVERDPFRIMNQQQQKLDEKRCDAEEWGGERSREWTQKLELLHETQSVSSVGNDLEPLQFPEQPNLVLMPDADDHPANQHSIERLHAEMDALIAESSAKQRL